MDRFKLLFYEDAYYENENTGFINDLKLELPDIRIFIAGSFERFERFASNHTMDAFILDIMGAETRLTSIRDGSRVNSSLLGIEMLARIRHGYYQLQCESSPVLMRTARADELLIRRMCEKFDCFDIFLPAMQDEELISRLKLSIGYGS